MDNFPTISQADITSGKQTSYKKVTHVKYSQEEHVIMAAPKKPVLTLPLKVILTQEGASYFIQQKKKLLRFKLADNVEEYGISMKSFTPDSLQRLISIDYVSKLEISLPEFVSLRQDIMDLSKLTVYAVLYKCFDRLIITEILESEIIKRYNRANPLHIIDEKTAKNNSMFRGKLDQKEVMAARKLILDPVWDEIMHNETYEIEEKNLNALMAEKYINNLSPFTWFLLTKFNKQSEYNELIRSIRLKLVDFMAKSSIAEYISLMLMELAINAENSNLRREAKKLYRGIVTDNDSTLIYDPEVRRKVFAELENKNELVFISWKLGGGSSSIGTKSRLQITVYNKNDEYEEVKESIENKKSANLNKKSLIDFYKDIPEGEADNNLGLYYLSYLNEACQKVNIKFESLVNQYSDSDLTVINLIFNF